MFFCCFLQKKNKTKRTCIDSKARRQCWNLASKNDVTTSVTLGITGGKGWPLQCHSQPYLLTLTAVRSPSLSNERINSRNVGTLIICLRRARNRRHISYESQIKHRRAGGVSLPYWYLFTVTFQRGIPDEEDWGPPPFVNSKTVDSWWISALFDLELLNMLNILF